MKNILLQAANVDYGFEIFKLLLGLGILIVIFLLFRAVALWYWKVDVIVSQLQKQVDQNNRMIEQQNTIIDGLVALNNKNLTSIKEQANDKE